MYLVINVLGAVSKAIVTAAGPLLKQECARKGNLIDFWSKPTF